MEKESADKKLDKEILADAKAQAERNIKKAEREAEGTLARAGEEARQHSGKIIENAKERASARVAVIEASIEVEAKRLALAAKEDTIQSILGESLQRMETKSNYDYPESLVSLGAEAVAKMSGESFVVTLDDKDANSLGDHVLKGIEERVKSGGGRNIRLRLAENPSHIGAGVIIETADGRERVDNSYKKRMERYRAQLRREIAEIIFPKEGKG